MRTITIIFFLLIIVCKTVYSQADETKPKEERKKDITDSVQIEDTLDRVAFYLKLNLAKRFNEQYDFNKIRIKVDNYFISDIDLYCIRKADGLNIHFKTENTISFNRKNFEEKFYNTRLVSSNLDYREEVFLRDVLFIERSSNEKLYKFESEVIELDTVNFRKSTNYNKANENFLQIRLLTDFNGFNKTEPNGLIQSEILTNFVFNIRASKSFKPLYNIRPFLNLTKMENDENILTVKYDSVTQRKHVNIFDLWQYSSIETGAQINIFRYDLNQTSIFLDYVPMVTKTELKDSLKTFSVFSGVHGVNLKIRVTPEMDPLLHLDLSLGTYFTTLLHPEIYQSRTNLNFIESGNNIQYANSMISKLVSVVPSLEICYKPKKSETKLFFRGTFFTDFTKGNNFLRLQFGTVIYTSEFTKALKK